MEFNKAFIKAQIKFNIAYNGPLKSTIYSYKVSEKWKNSLMIGGA